MIPAGFRALAAFGTVLLIGAAFIHRDVRQREAERRVGAAEAADRVALALSRETAAALAALRRAAAALQRAEGSFAEVAEAAMRDTAIEMAFIAAGERIAERHPARAVAVDADEWREAGRAAGEWSGPLRVTGAERKMLARVALPAGDAPGTLLVGVVDLERMLQKAQLPGLAAAGLEHRLVAPGTGRAALLSGSARVPQGAIVREIDAADARWLLAVAPAAGPALPWQTLLMHGLIVLALAVAAGLGVAGRAHDHALLERKLGARTERLRETTRKLAEEIRQREELEKQFAHASFHDALTGLPTRRVVVNRLEAAMRPARGLAAGQRLAVAIVELDRVKAISDSLGLAVGDELLVRAARRLEDALGAGDRTVGRLRDAEFACVLPRLESEGEALAIVERMRHALLQPFSIAGQTLYTGAQAGIAFGSPQLGHPEDLLRGAHIALSHARASRAPLMVFDPTTQEQVISRQQLESDLHGVAERGELLVRYQPIVALATREIVGFEALVRWQHPVEGMIPPAMFIPLAEETGLIGPVTRWVLREACTAAHAWREALPEGRGFYVSVNLSAHDMRQPDLAEYVEALVAEFAISPGMLRLEVTEGVMIDNPRAAVELMARLRQTGARILLDDFGTGYSSLSYLHRFPIDYLKIDQSFVRRMTPDPKSSGIVRAILYLAEAMGIETVAEGVETAEVMRLLAELHCAYGQGYHFSRPVEAESALAMLDAHRDAAANRVPPSQVASLTLR